jgi:uncharacterized protein
MSLFSTSRYSFVIPLKGERALVHNTVSGATALLEQKDCEILANPDAPLDVDGQSRLKELLYGGFLIPKDVDELAVVRQDYERQRFDPRNMILTITPTLG